MTPRTDWKEEIEKGEEYRFEEQAQALKRLQLRKTRGRERALHVKRHVSARALVTVLPDLPEYARVGTFAAPRTFEAWARFSNAAFGAQSDHAPDLHGFALKLLGVPGRQLIPELKDATTQDFLMVTTPTQGFRNSAEFVFFVTAAANPLTFIPRAAARFGLKRTLGLLRGFMLAGKPVPSLAAQRYWSVAPIRWGDYAVKYQALPLATASGEVPPGRDYLGGEMIARLAKGPVEFDLVVQFYCDPKKTPIEDAAIEWREEDAPLLTIAKVTLPQQDLRSETGQQIQRYVETLSFDPYHAPDVFQPLGEIQRARRHAYMSSGRTRNSAPEPRGSEAVVPEEAALRAAS